MSLFLPAGGRCAGPVDTAIVSRAIYSGEENSFLPGQEGLRLKKGLNLLAFEHARVGFSTRTVLYLELKQDLAAGFARAELFKFYFSARFAGLFFLAGKDSVNIGPSDSGMLLSKNAAPFPMLRITNETPLRFLGDWHFLALNGWFYEEGSGRKSPRLLAARAQYSPWPLLTLAGTRTAYYGGRGRPGYELWEYPKVFLGSRENSSGSRYDTDGYIGYDVTAAVPEKLLPWKIEKARFYYENMATDAEAFWQTEDRGQYYFPLGIKLQLNSYTGGLVVETEKDKLLFEFRSVNGMFYTHHWYPAESYKGLSFGNPYGRNLHQALVRHERKTGENTGFKYELGYVRQPAFIKPDAQTAEAARYYAFFALLRRSGGAALEPFARLDLTKNRNTAPGPVPPGRFDTRKGSRLFATLGLSAAFGF